MLYPLSYGRVPPLYGGRRWPFETVSVTVCHVKSRRLSAAVHILTFMAHEGAGPLSSEFIASSVNTNPVVVRRILAALAKAGLVVSVPGTRGGSRLARPADAISLADVHDAVEDGDPFPLHEHPNAACPVGRHIHAVLEGHLDDAARAMRQSLAGASIGAVTRAVTGRHRSPKRR